MFLGCVGLLELETAFVDCCYGVEFADGRFDAKILAGP